MWYDTVGAPNVFSNQEKTLFEYFNDKMSVFMLIVDKWSKCRKFNLKEKRPPYPSQLSHRYDHKTFFHCHDIHIALTKI